MGIIPRHSCFFTQSVAVTLGLRAGWCEVQSAGLTTLKEIDQLDESKVNTTLQPKAKSRPPKDCDILGFDMKWESSTNELISSLLAWFKRGKFLRGVFEYPFWTTIFRFCPSERHLTF